MIEGKKVLAVIPARGGSKALPRKNLRMAGGKPLLAWTVEEAKKSKFIDRLILSSEDEEIIGVAGSLGCEVPFVRPAELAKDEVSALETVLHAIKELPGYDYAVLLQPPIPLRTVEDIDGCLEQCLRHDANACVSVVVPDKSPYWMFTLDHNRRLVPLIKTAETGLQRQDLPEVYLLNGAVYVAKTDWLIEHKTFITRETLAYPMPKERSLDIDTEEDLNYFEFLLKARK